MNFQRSFLITALIVFSGIGIFAQTPLAVAQAPDAETAGLRLEAFDKVWSTVNDNHYDPTFGGVNWNKVREDYLPRATTAKTEADFNGVLRQMLGELKLSHFGIFPKNLAAIAAGSAGIGVELKMIDGRPVVTRVEQGSTAEAAGVANGSYIRKIGGADVGDLLKPLEASFAQRQLNGRLKIFYRQRMIEALVAGPADSKVTLELVDGNDKARIVEIERKPFSGEMSQPMGFFPAQPVVFESKRLAGNIGYIRFNMWVIPQMAKIRAAVRDFSDAKGIVFDLRGNPGGVGGMAPGIAGLVMDKRSSLGRMKMRSGTVDFSRVDTFVLDEADRMMDMGFWPDVKRIAATLPEASKRQTLLFSATMPDEVMKLLDEIVRDPQYVQVGSAGGPARSITHEIENVAAGQKTEWLAKFLRRTQGPVLVFMRTKSGAERLARQLQGFGIKAAALHADRTQQQRTAAVEGFRGGNYHVLVATDVAARGLDIDGITHVVNYEVPTSRETYVHRVGRTGRAAATGTALTLVAPEELRALEALQRSFGAEFQG